MGSATEGRPDAKTVSRSRPALLVFLAPVVVGALFYAVAPAPLKVRCTDFSVFFEPLGESIAHGKGHRYADGTFSLAITPGYPLIVATMIRIAETTGLPRNAVYVTFVLLAFGTTSLLLYLIASTLWRPALAASASVLWMLYPLALWMAKLAGTEMPFTILILAGVWLLWRQSTRDAPSGPLLFIVGLTMGLAMLMRPFGVGLGIVSALFVLVRFRSRSLLARLVLCCMVLAGNLAAVLPWQIYAYRSTGATILLSSISADTLKLGLTFSAASRGGSARRDLDLPRDVLALMEDIYRDESLTSTQGLVLRLARELGHRPMAVVKLLLIKAGRSLYATHSGDYEGWILAIQAVFLMLLLGATVLTWRARPDARWLVVLAGLFILYSWAMASLVALPLVRYMVSSLSLGFLFTPELVRALGSRAPGHWLGLLPGVRQR